MDECNADQQPPGHAPAPPGGDLVDQVLLAEIELLTDLIAAVVATGSRLTAQEVDSLLGVSE